MTRLSPAIRLAILLVLAALGPSGCYAEGTGVSGLRVKRRAPSFDGGLTGIVDAGTGPARDGGAKTCPPADTLEHVPALTAAMSTQASQSGTMFVGDLFNKFNSNCGGCHVSEAQGDPPFQVLSLKTFSDDMAKEDVLSRIFTDDTTKVMPLGAAPASQRSVSTDGALQLGALLKTWYKQGRPPNIFVLDTPSVDAGADGGAAVSWVLASNVGKALTNLGNCIPSKDVVGVLDDKLDDFFAAATELPQRLEQTDLTTFDSEVLAEHGVIAYAPAYPLWSDDARKIRYVRVPRGQSIKFDKATQQFVIPDHTRFYKTFLRKVIEKDGTEHYRKIETRLIVANSNKNFLFGTYQWDANDETKGAVLDNEPLRNYSVFKDRLITYIADEGKYEAITNAEGGAGGDDLTRTLVKAGAIRHYAIPGSDRCVQCHMGSPSRSFVLGFTPLQINRRPLGVGGIIEPPGPDELTQLQRLIDYGVITGIKDPTDPTEVLPLEKSEGTRAPRNDYELTAQGYMVGNCAHCHNPNGYPSVQNPVLATTLSFLPGPGPIDGIFQFPLEKFSPRITRDLGGAVQLPYITPSLVDYPGQADYNHTVDHASTSTIPAPAKGMVLAPWRSLLYRAVDTPFPYSVDLALFPHMPMNVPGYDCRITKIMGDWMVSVPAVRKHPEIDETLVQGFQPTLQPPLFTLHDNTGTDTEFQPYTEVLPPDPSKPDQKQQADYDAAKKAADDRLNAYHKAGADGLSVSKNDWARYNYCPDTSDIQDPTVTGADKAHLVPSDLKIYKSGDQTYNVPVDYQPFGSSGGVYDENLIHVPSTATIVWPDEGVPDRPHWVTTDTTDNPPPWVPRRDDWAKILHDHKYTTEDGDQEKKVVEMLSPSTGGTGVRLSQNVLDFVGNEIPFGLWKPNDACAAKLASQKKVSDYAGAARPKWMDVVKAQADSPVYSELPGAAVFNMVCVNCHGPQADSHGRQADTLQLMTGGNARVANLRDGFFGPTSSPGANRKAVFDITPNDPSAPGADDWAARYLPWMALGGTQKLIPRAILNVVATTPILGVPRNLQGVDSANMLGPVQTLCAELFRKSTWNVLPGTETTTPFDLHVDNPPSAGSWGNWLWTSTVDSAQGRLIGQNGDAELWPKLCGLNNPMPVAAIRMEGGLNAGAFKLDDFEVTFYDSGSYPVDQPIGNDHGAVDVGVLTTNTQPWCVVRPEDSGDIAETYTQINSYQTADGKSLPLCPSSFVAGFDQQSNQLTYDRLTQWSYRGAINAGLAVFVYLDKVAKGYTPVPPYDQCQSLP